MWAETLIHGQAWLHFLHFLRKNLLGRRGARALQVKSLFPILTSDIVERFYLFLERRREGCAPWEPCQVLVLVRLLHFMTSFGV